ncbi:hypothetical protein BDQ12DRAFT_146112 [Crucibulum laeve]|uniref:Short chain type dehydrogenase n=1 Tax=Crucibulum laeve TaxID=68775 RepID=A0A5C3LYD5_9AGAR|nr:hypothetical protein BDQ12DRAFT_146112 [Crucibulum laeve]
MSSLVAFIIGAGSRVSTAVGTSLKENGYSVAFGSRNPNVEAVKAQGFYPITVDAGKVESIKSAFAKVKAELGTPNVVIYNAASFVPPSEPGSPLSLPADGFESSATIGLNVFYAAQEALTGFRSLKSGPKAFIVTGNLLPFIPATNPLYFGLGTQKTISAKLVENFAHAYKAEGIQFYFASLVASDGGIPPFPDFDKSGPTHAQVYWELISNKEQVNWDHRFTLDGKKLPNYD